MFIYFNNFFYGLKDHENKIDVTLASIDIIFTAAMFFGPFYALVFCIAEDISRDYKNDLKQLEWFNDNLPPNRKRRIGIESNFKNFKKLY